MDKTTIATPPPKLTHRHIVDSIRIGRERMADAKAALKNNPASSENRRAREAKAKQACAPIVAAMRADQVRPAFRTLVASVNK